LFLFGGDVVSLLRLRLCKRGCRKDEARCEGEKEASYPGCPTIDNPADALIEDHLSTPPQRRRNGVVKAKAVVHIFLGSKLPMLARGRALMCS